MCSEFTPLDENELNNLFSSQKEPATPKKEDAVATSVKKISMFMKDAIVRSRQDYHVNPERSKRYYVTDRSDDFYPDIFVPIGVQDSIHYKGEATGGVTDRDILKYLSGLFPDEYNLTQINQIASEYIKTHNLKAEDGSYYLYHLAYFPIKESADPIFGGCEVAFEPGKVVLELGCGRAIGLMQIAERYPDTTFIGCDILYQEKRKIFLQKPGLQLTQSSWEDLSFIPDNTVDTIISLQGVMQWGIRGVGGLGGYDFDTQTWKSLLSQFQTKLKSGGCVRFDILEGDHEILAEHIGESIWEINKTHTQSLLALRKR